MKLIAFLSRLALAGVSAFALCAAFNMAAIAAFAIAASTLVLLIGARDYAPRRVPFGMATTVSATRRREAMPLAA